MPPVEIEGSFIGRKAPFPAFRSTRLEFGTAFITNDLRCKNGQGRLVNSSKCGAFQAFNNLHAYIVHACKQASIHCTRMFRIPQRSSSRYYHITVYERKGRHFFTHAQTLRLMVAFGVVACCEWAYLRGLLETSNVCRVSQRSARMTKT
jgi:hypothetical protein